MVLKVLGGAGRWRRRWLAGRARELVVVALLVEWIWWCGAGGEYARGWMGGRGAPPHRLGRGGGRRWRRRCEGER